MKVARVGIALSVMCLTALASAPQGIALLRQAWVGHEFYLRGFWAGSRITTDATGKPVASTTAGPWTLAQVLVDGVDAKGHSILVRGFRMVQVYEPVSQSMVAEPWPSGTVTIRVQTDPKALTAAGVQRLQSALFLRGPVELAAELPAFWQPFARKALPPIQPLPPGATDAAPVLMPDPQYTEAARVLCIQGKDRVGVEINAQGRVERCG